MSRSTRGSGARPSRRPLCRRGSTDSKPMKPPTNGCGRRLPAGSRISRRPGGCRCNGCRPQRAGPTVFRTRVPSLGGGVHGPPFRSRALRRNISKRGSTGSRDKLPPTFFLRGSRKESNTPYGRAPGRFNKGGFSSLSRLPRSARGRGRRRRGRWGHRRVRPCGRGRRGRFWGGLCICGRR